MLTLQAEVAGHAVGDRVRASHVDSGRRSPAGSGAVVRIGGEQCAVYRDETGTAAVVGPAGGRGVLPVNWPEAGCPAVERSPTVRWLASPVWCLRPRPGLTPGR